MHHRSVDANEKVQKEMHQRAGSTGANESDSWTSSAAPTPATTKTTVMQNFNENGNGNHNSNGNGIDINQEKQRRFTPEKDAWNGKYEFGGWKGALAIMLYSHCVLYYFWYVTTFYQATVIYPGHVLLKGRHMSGDVWDKVSAHASLRSTELGVFIGFLCFEYLLAIVVPGPRAMGLPIPSENGVQYAYRCNAVGSWYITLSVAAILHYTDVFPLWTLSENYGHYMTAAILVADASSIVMYLHALLVKKNAVRISGNHVYDFFMGATLTPRLPGGADIKMVAELRNSWGLLFLNTMSFVARAHKDSSDGTVSLNLAFFAFGIFLYANACHKGEECVITTWDIFYEKFGWMLGFWNCTGVPYLYCIQAMYLQQVAPKLQYSYPVLVLMLVVLCAAYYVFDTANAQKNHFRMQRQGLASPNTLHRNTFPHFQFQLIESPKTLQGEEGELFIDGWYKYARKIHFTADMIMATLWCLSCGFESFVPYFYLCFFVPMLLHRAYRDEEKCRAKYKSLWKRYTTKVPYRFVPGVC